MNRCTLCLLFILKWGLHKVCEYVRNAVYRVWFLRSVVMKASVVNDKQQKFGGGFFSTCGVRIGMPSNLFMMPSLARELDICL